MINKRGIIHLPLVALFPERDNISIAKLRVRYGRISICRPSITDNENLLNGFDTFTLIC